MMLREGRGLQSLVDSLTTLSFNITACQQRNVGQATMRSAHFAPVTLGVAAERQMKM